MAQKNKHTCGDCVTITKDRYKQLLDYEKFTMWVLNLIVVSSLPNIVVTEEKMKEMSNDAKCKAIQEAFHEALNRKE